MAADSSSSNPSPAAPSSTSVPGLSQARRLVLMIAFAVGCLLLGALASPTIAAGWARLMADDNPAQRADGDGPSQWYQSQMHPWIIQPYPGQCPICNMDLTPVDPARFGAELTISPLTVQNIGVASQPAVLAPLQREIRSVGVIEFDPGRLYDMNLRTAAWVENLAINAVGDRVEKGQRLYDLVSQELYAAQVEYLQVRDDERLREAVLRRMRYLGMSDVSALEKAGKPLEAVPVLSPIDGVVVSRDVVEGVRMSSGSSALRLAADDKLWIRVTLFEHQLSEIKAGLKAAVTLRDGREVSGELAYIEPTLDPMTRSLAARIVIDNPLGNLRPGGFATVRIGLPEGAPAVLVPRSSVVSSGERNMVFVSLGRGRFSPREVQLGAENMTGDVEILNGVAAGEAVVSSGQFLIDAESRMMEALSRMITGDVAAQAESPALAQGSSDLNAVDNNQDTDSAATSAPQAKAFAQLLAIYEHMAQSLYTEDLSKIDQHFMAFNKALAEVSGDVKAISDVLHELQHVSQEVATLRPVFGKLGIILRDKALAEKLLVGSGWTVFHCGMADAPEEGIWLQSSDQSVLNPFFGARSGMRSCYIEASGLGESL